VYLQADVSDRAPDLVEARRKPLDLHRLELRVTSVTPPLTLARPEVHMYARVWKLVILPGKVEEFAVVINSMMPTYRRQAGFRGLLVLRGGPGEKLEATAVSAWESLVALRNSENSAFEQLLARILPLCEHHPSMREEEVMVSEFISQDLTDTATHY